MNACKDCKFYEEYSTPVSGLLKYCRHPDFQKFDRVEGLSSGVSLNRPTPDRDRAVSLHVSECDRLNRFTPKPKPTNFWKRYYGKA